MSPIDRYTLTLLGVVSLITFCTYGIDKWKAKHNRFRVPEVLLLGMGLCCGAYGALLGMKVFRHKTKHIAFQISAPAGAVLSLVVMAAATAKLTGII